MSRSFFIFLNKPIGLSSHTYLKQFQKKFALNKVGHHGTLDPFASGLLLVGVNEALKFVDYISDTKKTYRAIVKLGEQTDTLDHTGQIIAEKDFASLDAQNIAMQLQTLVGDLEQVPPMYSALKVDGKKLYKLARQGKELERQARVVHVSDLKLLNWQSPFLTFETTVSRGTYIRVLAEQIAALFATVGHLTFLQRVVLNDFSLEQAYSLSDESPPEKFTVPIEKLLTHLPRIDLDLMSAKKIKCGQWVLGIDLPDNPLMTAFYQEKFLGIVEVVGQILKPKRLMNLDFI